MERLLDFSSAFDESKIRLLEQTVKILYDAKHPQVCYILFLSFYILYILICLY